MSAAAAAAVSLNQASASSASNHSTSSIACTSPPDAFVLPPSSPGLRLQAASAAAATSSNSRTNLLVPAAVEAVGMVPEQCQAASAAAAQRVPYSAAARPSVQAAGVSSTSDVHFGQCLQFPSPSARCMACWQRDYSAAFRAATAEQVSAVASPGLQDEGQLLYHVVHGGDCSLQMQLYLSSANQQRAAAFPS